MKLSFPLREQTREILLAIEKCEELCGSEVLEKMSNPTPKSIYVVLSHLEKGSWLQSRIEKIPGERNRPRRYYKLTKLGKEAIKFQRICEEAATNSSRVAKYA